MFVGVARLIFHLPAARSLKDKRAAVRSFRDRIQARHKVSIAEVADLDLLQRAVLGVAVVSNDAAVCDEQLAAVASAASVQREAVLTDVTTEILPFGEGGRGLLPGSSRLPHG